MKLVVYPPVDAARLTKISEAAGGVQVANASDGPSALREIVDADAFFGKLTPELLAAATRLKWVQSPTASLEHYVFPELVDHPCTLTNMRGLFSDVIADHVFGYILCFARNLHLYIRQQMRGKWEPIGGEKSRSSFAAGPGEVSDIDKAHRHLSDCQLGIVGFGAIGSEIARRGVAFGMRVVGVDPHPRTPPDGVDSVGPLEELGELLASSDFVVIAAPHTPKTAGMFGADEFRRMKNSAFLINIGRGVIVQLDALRQALREAEIAGAGLDVFENEPLPADDPLWQMENTILTPHVAAASVRIAERHLEVLLENVRRFTRGEPLRNVASKKDWF